MKLTQYRKPAPTTWGSFGRLGDLHQELDQLLNMAWPFASAGQGEGSFGDWAPALDVAEDKDSVVVTAELPGMKKEEIEVNLHEGVLTISGERKQEATEENEQLHRSERYYGSFKRSVVLPTAVVGDKIKAAYKDGILSVTMPKSEEAKPRQIEVTVE